jgi:hypothetical protein
LWECPGARLAWLPFPGGAPPSNASYDSQASLAEGARQLNHHEGFGFRLGFESPTGYRAIRRGQCPFDA